MLMIAAMLFSYSPVPYASPEAKTITYTSLSTITEGATNATITRVQFATTTHMATNITRTLTSYVGTTTVFVEVRCGVTKEPRVVYHYATITIPRTATVWSHIVVETALIEGTLTTYASPPVEETGVVDRTLVMYLCTVALAAVVVLGWARLTLE